MEGIFINIYSKTTILILIVSTMIIFTACTQEGGIGDDIFTTEISGVVAIDGTPVQGVSVAINSLNITTTTDSNGHYQFTDIQNGTYQISFKNDAPFIEKTIEVIVNGESVTADLNLNETGEKISEAEAFVNSLNDSGLQMKETIEDRLSNIRPKIDQQVLPYMNDMSYKLSVIAQILEGVFEGTDGDYFADYREGSMLLPGTYEIDFTKDPVDTSASPNVPDDTAPFVWNLTVYDSIADQNLKITSTISVTNPNEIIIYDENGELVEYDFTKADFSYDHTYTYNGEVYTADIGFGLISTSAQTIIGDDGIQRIIPDIANIEISGSIEDNVTIEFDDGTVLGPIGSAVIDGIDSTKATLSFDFSSDTTSNPYLHFVDVRFKCEVLELLGALEIEFFDLPAYEDIGENTYPEISIVKVDDSIDIFNVIRLPSGFQINQKQLDINGESVPVIDSFSSYGNIYLPEDQDFPETALKGDLLINPDYTTRDFSVDSDPYREEKEDDYIGGDIQFEGYFEKSGFNPIELTIEVIRTGYRSFSATVDYYFNDGQSVNATINYEEEIFTISATSNTGLELSVEIDENADYSGETHIGDIKDKDGVVVAEVFMIDGTPQVIFDNGNTSSLLF